MSTQHSSIRRLVSIGYAAVLFAACSGGQVLDNDRLQSVIASGLNDNGITATVTCPDNRPLQQGDVFTCQAVTDDGLGLTVQVTQTDNTGNVNWQLVGH
jgi:uncharacterized protein DUF4333